MGWWLGSKGRSEQLLSVRRPWEHVFAMDRDSLRLLLAQGVSVEEIGRRFGKHPATVSYWMKKFGFAAPNREKHSAKGGIDEKWLQELVAQGLSIAEIAAAVGRSKTTVRHWLRRNGLNTHAKDRRGAVRDAKVAGTVELVLRCKHHGETEFTLEGRGYYRCKRCRMERVMRRRRKLKELLVAEAGGCCCICGYDRHPRALEFHHVDPEAKRFQISWNGVTQSLETLRREARKCVLLCSNCHAEVEDGVATLPATVSTAEDNDAP
jgi:transposase